MQSAAAIVSHDGWLRRTVAIGRRYGIATVGPLSVSAANFLASLALLRTLPTADFGLYAFIFIVMAFCFSLSNALIASPYAVLANRQDFSEEASKTFFKANLLFALFVGLLCAGVSFAMRQGSIEAALLFGVFGIFSALRWFARAHCYTMHAPLRVAAVDFAYATLMLSGLGLALLLHGLTLNTALITFVTATAAAVLASSKDYLDRQFAGAIHGRLDGYASIWRNQARWSLLGVVTTEASGNAHAYLVTLMAGQAAFAPLAAAALFMKPLTMCANSLIQLERPAMARAIGLGHLKDALRRRLHFRWAMMLCWLATVSAAAVIFLEYPALILSEAYDLRTVMLAVTLCAANEAINAWILPDAVLLQAADRFRLLASSTIWSAAVTVTSAFTLLTAFGPVHGPVASLFGVLLGGTVLAVRFTLIVRAWKSAHA